MNTSNTGVVAYDEYATFEVIDPQLVPLMISPAIGDIAGGGWDGYCRDITNVTNTDCYNSSCGNVNCANDTCEGYNVYCAPHANVVC